MDQIGYPFRTSLRKKKREEKATFKAEAGALHCKVLKKAAMSNTMLEKYAGHSSGIAFRTAWPSPLGFKAFLSCGSFPVEQYQIVDDTPSLVWKYVSTFLPMR